MGNAFLTGWSLPASFFSVHDNTKIIDSTDLVASLFKENESGEQFNLSLLNWFEHNHPLTESISGFSLGAILTIQLAQQIEFKRVTLLAPTLSFISRPEHPSGVNPRVLKRMIRAIDTKCDTVLHDFDTNCGIEQTVQRNYTKESLKIGLQFLQSVNLPDAPLLGNPEITIIHGVDDQIIPIASCEKVASLCNTSIETRSGGHISALK